MPELPEIEVLKRQLNTCVLNKRIKDIKVADTKLRYDINLYAKDFIDNSINTIERRGKNFLFYLNNINFMINLGLTGTIQVKSHIITPEKYNHVVITFDDNSSLVFNDPRKFGFCVAYKDDPLNHLTHWGVEPLTDEFNASYLFDKCRNSKRMIKQILMDNKIVVGIGNVYACEVLYVCHISPFSLGKNLSENNIKDIVKNSKKILLKSISMGGNTFRDYRHINGERGQYVSELLIYQKSICNKCLSKVSREVIGGRGTYFCAQCQKIT